MAQQRGPILQMTPFGRAVEAALTRTASTMFQLHMTPEGLTAFHRQCEETVRQVVLRHVPVEPPPGEDFTTIVVRDREISFTFHPVLWEMMTERFE